jgi:7-cyano-7-deazaguanine synthase in queuosine biosynthesis
MKKKTTDLNTISKKEFSQRIRKRQFENIELINFIEKYFIEKRGYVFKMPKPGESVILLYSGGLDSTVAWSYLIEKYKLHVYPLVLIKNMDIGQVRSIKYFKKYFKNKYGEYYHEPLEFKSRLFPPKLFKRMFDLKQVHPECLFHYLDENFQVFKFLPGLNALNPIFGVIYQKYLENQYNLKIMTIFLGVLAGDGIEVSSQSFTFLRKTMFFLDDFVPSGTLQIASIFFEKELGFFSEKSDIIKMASEKLKLPLEKTYSCYRKKLFHCNSCLACYSRSLGFQKAKKVDKTLYYDKLLIVKELTKLKNILYYYLMKGKSLCNHIKHQVVKKF